MLRVAYDVSSVVPSPGAEKIVTGIGRVIEEHLACLRKSPALDIKVIGAFGGDWNPVITSLCTERWASHMCVPPVACLRAFATKAKIGKTAVDLLYRFEERLGRGSETGTGQRVRVLATAALRRFVRTCVDIGISRADVDLFHATFRAPPDWLPASLPRVATIHDVIPLRHPEESGPHTTGMLKSLLDALDPARDVAVAVSKFTKDDFCDLSGFPPDRVVVAHLSAGPCFRPVHDPERLDRVRVRFGLQDDPFILCVANPQPRKNIPLLVRSFYGAASRLSSWTGRLVLVGNPKAGWGSEAIDQEVARRPEFEGRIIRARGVSDEDLACLYSGCEAFVFPSTYEGFGLPVLEALQCAAPVICSNRSSLPEVVGDAGVMVDPSDEKALTDMIVDLVTNPERRDQLRTLGVRQAAKFTWESSAENVAKAYMMAVSATVKPEGGKNPAVTA
jgi:glycosyltransferase involved in cell wall biosynthesis